MEQHPVPRQITTFEFKLIGFLTVKQFIYIAVFAGLAVAVYGIVRIPLVNFLFAALTAGTGIAFAFLPINDRPLDVWVKNLLKRLTSPTQYVFKKNNPPLAFLKNPAVTAANSKTTAAHIDSQKKLASYLGTKPPVSADHKKSINTLLEQPLPPKAVKNEKIPAKPVNKSAVTPAFNKPFFSGMVKNHQGSPLYGILIYIKNQPGDQPLRILKTNVNGIFATFSPLPPADYIFELKDPMGNYLFDTMKFTIGIENHQPLEIHSKELF